MAADIKMIIINIVVLAGAIIFSLVRYHSGKVKMESLMKRHKRDGRKLYITGLKKDNGKII